MRMGTPHTHTHDHSTQPSIFRHTLPTSPFSPLSPTLILNLPLAFYATLAQFLLEAWLWVSGQQIGSLACTGLCYWVVFDAFGVGLGGGLPGFLAGWGSGEGGREGV